MNVVRFGVRVVKVGRDSECSEIWEREYGEGRNSSEGSEGGESEPQATDGSLYIPTPERPRTVVRPILLPNRLCVFELSQLGHFVSMVNANRSCTIRTTDVVHVSIADLLVGVESEPVHILGTL